MNPHQPVTRKPARTRRGWRTRLRARLPSVETVRGNRWIGWLGPALHHPRLWHINRHGVALGLAIGLFFGLLIPLAQIPVAAVTAVWLRANILVAVTSTLVTNPFTFAPIYFFAYRLGALLVGNSSPRAQAALQQAVEQASSISMTWSDTFVSVGKPLIVGLSVLAAVISICAYFLALGAWRVYVVAEWRRRRVRQARQR